MRDNCWLSSTEVSARYNKTAAGRIDARQLGDLRSGRQSEMGQRMTGSEGKSMCSEGKRRLTGREGECRYSQGNRLTGNESKSLVANIVIVIGYTLTHL